MRRGAGPMEVEDFDRRTLLKGGGAAFAGLTVLSVAGPAHAFPGEPGLEVWDRDVRRRRSDGRWVALISAGVASGANGRSLPSGGRRHRCLRPRVRLRRRRDAPTRWNQGRWRAAPVRQRRGLSVSSDPPEPGEEARLARAIASAASSGEQVRSTAQVRLPASASLARFDRSPALGATVKLATPA
jgi:hypothetical protein